MRQLPAEEVCMPIDMRIWRIDNGKLQPLPDEKLALEKDLESWLTDDISMVSEDLMVIGKQLPSDLGGRLDLLAIHRSGDLGVLELKRDMTSRDVVAQALHYAAWVKGLTSDRIGQIASAYLGEGTLEERFEAKFEEPLPDTINSACHIYIVAADIDPISESIVRFLSEEYGVNINVIFFRHFRDADGSEFLGRSWLMEPSQVEIRETTSRPKRLQQRGQPELFVAITTAFNDLGLPFRARSSTTGRWSQIRIGSNQAVYEWGVLKRDSSLDAQLFFICGQPEETSALLDLLRSHFGEIAADKVWGFSAEPYGKGGSAVVKLRLPYEGDEPSVIVDPEF